MDTLTPDRTAKNLQAQPQGAYTPPPLRLPRFLLQHLARPLNTLDDVDQLVAQIRMAQWRGLL
jgi:hypothetical protein